MAKVPLSLLDACNLLGEAVDLIEAGFMASIEVPDQRMREALRGVLSKAGDIARSALDELNEGTNEVRGGDDV